MNRFRLKGITLVMLGSLIMSGCTSKNPKRQRVVYSHTYDIPIIPAEWVRATAIPIRKNWKDKTQRDVGVYIVDLRKSIEVGNVKLLSIREFMAQLRKKNNKIIKDNQKEK